MSPYNYVANNPIILFDPDGKGVERDYNSFVSEKKITDAANHNSKIITPEAQKKMLNNVGPGILDAASVCFLLSGPAGAPFAAGASWLSFVWSASIDNHGVDALTSLTTNTFETVIKNPKKRIQLAFLQLGYDLLLAGEDTNYESNENNGTAEADNTRVTNPLLQSVVREIWGTSLSPQEMWDEMHSDSEDDEQDENNTD